MDLGVRVQFLETLFLLSPTMIPFQSWNVYLHLFVSPVVAILGFGILIWHFVLVQKRILSAGYFPWPKARGYQKTDQSPRYAWSFSLCPEVDIGQENPICVFSLLLQPGTSPEHTVNRDVFLTDECCVCLGAGLLQPQRSLQRGQREETPVGVQPEHFQLHSTF